MPIIFYFVVMNFCFREVQNFCSPTPPPHCRNLPLDKKGVALFLVHTKSMVKIIKLSNKDVVIMMKNGEISTCKCYLKFTESLLITYPKFHGKFSKFIRYFKTFSTINVFKFSSKYPISFSFKIYQIFKNFCQKYSFFRQLLP